MIEQKYSVVKYDPKSRMTHLDEFRKKYDGKTGPSEKYEKMRFPMDEKPVYRLPMSEKIE